MQFKIVINLESVYKHDNLQEFVCHDLRIYNFKERK
jgi:hypothetical protein